MVRLLGTDIEVDDYLCKPADPREVDARVKAVLRRARKGLDESLGEQPRLDYVAHTVCWSGQTVQLSRIEFRLLDLFAHAPGRTFSRSQIKRAIYGGGYEVHDRAIDSHVKNLRKKLIDVDGLENPIRSVYGVGYTGWI